MRSNGQGVVHSQRGPLLLWLGEQWQVSLARVFYEPTALGNSIEAESLLSLRSPCKRELQAPISLIGSGLPKSLLGNAAIPRGHLPGRPVAA